MHFHKISSHLQLEVSWNDKTLVKKVHSHELKLVLSIGKNERQKRI